MYAFSNGVVPIYIDKFIFIPTEVQYVPAEPVNTCFKADGYSNYRFGAPHAGEIIGVKLVHTSGYVACSGDSGISDWGCGTNTMVYISMIEWNTLETWYPNADTDGVSGTEPLDENCIVDASYGCSVQRYNLDGYSGKDSEELEWRGVIREVTKDNKWSIQVST